MVVFVSVIHEFSGSFHLNAVIKDTGFGSVLRLNVALLTTSSSENFTVQMNDSAILPICAGHVFLSLPRKQEVNTGHYFASDGENSINFGSGPAERIVARRRDDYYAFMLNFTGMRIVDHGDGNYTLQIYNVNQLDILGNVSSQHL